MTEAEIHRHSSSLTALSIFYLALAFLLTTQLGPVGFVFANCVNMIVRIVLSVRVILRVFHNHPQNPLQGLLPDTDLLFTIISGIVCCQLSEVYFYQWSPMIHFSIGAIVFVILISSIIIKEDFILAFLVEKFAKKNVEEEETALEEETMDDDKEKTE